MYNYPADYLKKSVSINGYVLKTKDLAKDQFVVLHYAADNSVLGLLCSYKKLEAAKLKNNQRVELLGTIYSDFTKFRKGIKIPIIRVSNYKIIPDPQPQIQDNSLAGNSNNNINILIDESNFLETIDAIYKDINYDNDDFINKNITITGFIFRAKEFRQESVYSGKNGNVLLRCRRIGLRINLFKYKSGYFSVKRQAMGGIKWNHSFRYN